MGNRVPTVTDYTEARSIPEALALTAVEDEEPIAVADCYKDPGSPNPKATAEFYHIENSGYDAFIEITTTPNTIITYLVRGRHNSSSERDLKNYWERMLWCNKQQVEMRDDWDAEWELVEVEDEYEEFFEYEGIFE